MRPEEKEGVRVLCRSFLLLLLAWLIAPGTLLAQEEGRVALVVGIGAYANAPKLESPVRDAQAMAAALGGLGFDVDLVLDPDYRQLGGSLREFGQKVVGQDLALDILRRLRPPGRRPELPDPD